MRVIKRYPNRKLYDTDDKRYITLDGIAELIRVGADVQVIDHTTDEDLTAVTLSQIIFEQEKRTGGFLPKSVLTGLVKSGGDTLNNLRRSLSAPLELLGQVDDEIEGRIQVLVSRGELARDEATNLREKLVSIRTDMTETASVPGQQIGRLFTAGGVPSRDEVENLTSQIEALSSRIDSLIEETENSRPTEPADTTE